jgi:hypothetical protein
VSGVSLAAGKWPIHESAGAACGDRSGGAVRLVETAFNYHPLRLTVLAAPDLDSLLTPDTDVERLPY